jgi:hypothetical protein
MGFSWLKLYVEILDDPKIGLMPDWLFRKFVQFLCVAQERNLSGLLGPVSELAWRLRSSEEDVLSALRTMSEIGIVAETPDGWEVVKFAKRQEAQSSTDRVREFRKRFGNENETKRYKGGNENETSPSSSISPSVSDSLGGGVGEGIPTPTEWDRRILAVYTQVTGQVAIPYDRTYQVLQDLDHILATYSDHDKAISDGKKVFSRWCNSQGANGKKYSPVNTSWLSWWLSERAPKPEVPQSSALDKALEALK